MLDPGTPGVYTITYDVTDSDGLSATQVVRTVTVEDTTAPLTVIDGAGAIALECSMEFPIRAGCHRHGYLRWHGRCRDRGRCR